MSHEETSPISTALQSLLPVAALLLMDGLGCWLTEKPMSSQYALAVLVAELILLIVFSKGQICNGQRGRLIKANNYLVLFWGAWALIAIGQSAVSVLLLSLIGGAVIGVIYLRRFLSVAAILAFVGSGLSLSITAQMAVSPLTWLRDNPVAQMLLGVILANLFLSISRNRLQGFIGLLPFAMAILLVLNVIYTLAMLAAFPEQVQTRPDLPAELPILLYFALHLVMMGILAVHILRKIKLDYFNLILLLLLAASLPLWLGFVI